MIKLIAFDIGQVLVHYDIYRAIHKIAPYSKLTLPQIPKKLFGKPLGIDLELGTIDGKEFHKRLFIELQLHDDNYLSYDVFVDMFNDIFWPNDEVIALMHLLSNTYDIGLISNTNRLHYEYLLDQYNMWQIIKYPILSFEVGIRKPDRRIYEMLVNTSGKKPDEILMIDDKPENITGALNAGFDAIQFKDIQSFYHELDQRNLLLSTPNN